MKLFVVTYQLKPPRLVPNLLDELQRSAYWWHYLDSTWLILTGETANELYSRLAPSFAQSDSMLVVQIRRTTETQGWLPGEAWDWINEKMPTVER
jgi:hypothetical protein